LARVSRGTAPGDSDLTDWSRAILREKVDPVDKVRVADVAEREEDPAARAALVGPVAAGCSAELPVAEVQVPVALGCLAGAED
jgi:hypothetical protein